jgi:hypothetical protein
MGDTDVTLDIRELEGNDLLFDFGDFQLSDCKIHSLTSFKILVESFELVVLDNNSVDLSPIIDEYIANNNDGFFDMPQSIF